MRHFHFQAWFLFTVKGLLEVLLFQRTRFLIDANSNSAWLVFVGCGFVLLSRREFPLPRRRHGEKWTSSYELKILQSLWSKALLAVLYVMFSFAILIIPLIPPYKNADGSAREVQGWYFTVIVSAIVLVAIAYYFAIHNSTWSILSLGGVNPEVCVFQEHDQTYGNRRRVRITTVRLSPSILHEEARF